MFTVGRCWIRYRTESTVYTCLRTDREQVRNIFSMLHWVVLQLFFDALIIPVQNAMHQGGRYSFLVTNRHIKSRLMVPVTSEVQELLVESEQQCTMKCMHFGYDQCVSMNFEKTTAVKNKCYLLKTDIHRATLEKNENFTHLSLPVSHYSVVSVLKCFVCQYACLYFKRFALTEWTLFPHSWKQQKCMIFIAKCE